MFPPRGPEPTNIEVDRDHGVTIEWEDGHVEGSLHVPYQELRDGIPTELRNADKPLAAACSAGNRSSLAASLLERAGIEHVIHVADGGIPDLVD